MPKRRHSFLPSQRRQTASLLDLCYTKTNKIILESLYQVHESEDEVEKARKFIHENLTSTIRQKILSDLVPFDDNANATWRFGCLNSQSRSACKIHSECKVLYNNSPQLLKLLFGHDITSLKINIKKISAVHCEKSLLNISKVLRFCDSNYLTEVVITGAHSGIDCYLSIFEDLCYYVKNSSNHLQKLHLPVGSNDCLRSCSKMSQLCSLTIERSHHLNHKGLMYLSDQRSYTRLGLKICHIGVFKHHAFNKVDVAKFLEKMVNLTSFSLLDHNRCLVNQDLIGAKVLTYSALKLAMTRAIFYHKSENGFQSSLKELKVVDRKLNPQYILETCPQLQSLYIDWQEELSEAPFEEYPNDWFNEMAKNPDWHQLSFSLTNLQIVFPKAHSIGYSCDQETLMALLKNMCNLEKLDLTALKGDPVPLDQILERLPKLKELILTNCVLCFSTNINMKHNSLKTLHVLEDQFQSNLVEVIPHRICNLVPNLEELILRPCLPLTFNGFLLLDVWILSRLSHLKRLEITLSSSDCSNNMPELVYVLRDFPALRYLTISWGTYVDVNSHRMARLMSWLQTAIDADNANIHIQLSYRTHSQLYLSPPENLT